MLKRAKLLGYCLLLLLTGETATAQQYASILQTGSPGFDAGVAVNVDDSGNIYSLGLFNEPGATLQNGTCVRTLTSKGGKDYFLVKYNNDLVLQWVVQIGGAGDEGGGDNWADLAFDAYGNVYLTGSCTGVCYFESAIGSSNAFVSGAGAEDVFVASYSPAGQLRWLRVDGGDARDEGVDLVVDRLTSQLYVCGRFSDTAVFGSQQLIAKGSSDAFVACYGLDGIFKKISTGGGVDEDLAYHIELDQNGDVLVAGGLCCNFSSAKYGDFTITNSGGWGGYVGKLNKTTFTWNWMTHIGGNGADAAGPALTDAANNIYVMYISGSDTPLLSSSGPPVSFVHDSVDLLLVKLNTSGEIQWVHPVAGSGNEDCFGACKDAAGNFYCCGYFSGNLVFGATTLQNSGNPDQFILKYDAAGNPVWAMQASGAGMSLGTRLTTDQKGNVYFTGSLYDSVRYGSFSLVSKGESDYVFGKIHLPVSYNIHAARTNICVYDSTLLADDSAFAGRNKQWLKDGVALSGETNRTLYVHDSGYYCLVASNGCGERDTSRVLHIRETMIPVPVVLTPDTALCAGDTITLTRQGNAAYTHRWSTGDTTMNVEVSPVADRYYYLRSTDGVCYSEPDSVFVDVVPYPVAAMVIADGTGYAPFTASFKNTSVNYERACWNFGNDTLVPAIAADTVYLYEDTGTFVVKLLVENKPGCRDSVTGMIQVTDSFCLFIPNAFSPNNDGRNDTWRFLLPGVKEYKVLLFDRWGEVIFSQTHRGGLREVNWDGVYKGTPLPEGVYGFLLEYVAFQRGVRGLKMGTVQLMR